MKSLFYKLIIAGVALTTLGACEKEGEQLVLQPGGTVALTSSATSVSLTSANAEAEAVTFSWTPAAYGFNAPASYTLQFDKAGNAFNAPVDVQAGNKLEQAFTVADFNALLLRLGIASGSAGQVDVRVKSDIAGSTVASIVSDTKTVSGTPYLVIIQYPSIYVPGAYQGWAPDKAPALASVKDDKVYEGYVYFKTASDFKFTATPSWDSDFGANGPGKLVAKGGNLSVTAPGYYLLKADLNALTWSATQTNWAVIGAATPRGWDAETPLIYDEASGTWQTTLDLKADVLKFRANNTWDINYGDTNGDGLLESGGENITVPAAGRYLITLNLSVGGNYSYKLTKL